MSQTSSNHCNTTVRIGGMTCASCELLLERKLKALPGVQSVDIDYRSGEGCIIAKTGQAPDRAQIAAVVEKAGYFLTDTSSAVRAGTRRWLEIGASLVIIFALYKLLQTFDLVSLAPATSGTLSVGGIFLIGIVAGTSSCLAVTGGLLLALAAKHNELHRAETSAQKFKPLLHFNLGRLASYFVLGGLIGLLGRSVTLSTTMTGYMNIVVALVMLYLGLSILGIIKKGSLPIRPPKKLSRWITGLSDSDHPAAPFTLGALTFFLPCGFTQSLQLAALASGSFATGAVIMGIFALGTLPSLIGISAVSSAAKGRPLYFFLRFSGTLVIVLALFNLDSGLALSGLSTAEENGNASPPPIVANDVQNVSMKVTSYGYEPQHLTIKAGVPVRWTVDGTDAFGCTSILTIPSLNIFQPLHTGENIIEFTAPKRGQLAFMCSMGMVRGSFTVL
jgi:uncharacterized protein